MTGNKIRQKTWFFCIITTVQEGSCPVLVQSACIANASSLLLCTKQLMHAACRQSLIEAYFGLIFFSRKLTCRKDWSLNGSRLLFIFSSSVLCILSWFFFFFLWWLLWLFLPDYKMQWQQRKVVSKHFSMFSGALRCRTVVNGCRFKGWSNQCWMLFHTLIWG